MQRSRLFIVIRKQNRTNTLLHLIWQFAIVVVGSSIVGCSKSSSGPSMIPVSGSVILDGDPLEEGAIKFLPVDPKLDLDQGAIKGGKFSFRAQAGKKKVEIFAYRKQKGIPPDPPDMMFDVNYISPKYNAQTILTAEVVREGSNEFEFILKSETK